jgi:hypothetical protein
VTSQLKRPAAQLTIMLDAIRNYTPYRRPILPPVPEVTVHIPGPVDRSYTVIDGPLLRNLFVETTQPKPERGTMCVLAKMEFFNDDIAWSKLRTKTYMRLHAVDPRVLLWPAGTKTIEANKHILNEDHFLFQNCFGGIWAFKYDINPKGRITRIWPASGGR